MATPTILVTGATGTVGSALVPALAARGANVRAVTRNPAASIPGAQTVVADLSAPGTLTPGLDGADALFLNSPSSEDAAEVQVGILDAAKASGVRRVVLLSQLGARTDSPVRFLRWHAAVEDHLAGLGLESTVLRPNLYLQALLAFAAPIAQGVLAAPVGTAAVSAVDTRHIAAVAAAVLTTSGHAGRTYTLTGPRAVTHAEIADALGAAIGSPVSFLDVPPAAFAAALEPYLPAWQVGGLVEDYAHYERGEAAQVTSAVTDVTGLPARDLAEFARDHAAAFVGAAASAAAGSEVSR